MTSFDEDDILKLLTDNSQIEWQIKKVYCDFNFCSTRIKSEFFTGTLLMDVMKIVI